MSITGFHAHVYFDAAEFDQAEKLCHAAQNEFGLHMGRMHSAPVGPHPRGSCQLTFTRELAGTVLPWLMENRAGLTIFVHGLSGDDLTDHTAYVMWLGDSEDLKLRIFLAD